MLLYFNRKSKHNTFSLYRCLRYYRSYKNVWQWTVVKWVISIIFQNDILLWIGFERDAKTRGFRNIIYIYRLFPIVVVDGTAVVEIITNGLFSTLDVINGELMSSFFFSNINFNKNYMTKGCPTHRSFIIILFLYT